MGACPWQHVKGFHEELGSKEWLFSGLLRGCHSCWRLRLPKPKPARRLCITKIFPVGCGPAVCKFFISAGGRRSGMMGCPLGGGMMGHRMMGAGACQLVEGRISPMGYCDLYAPRSA